MKTNSSLILLFLLSSLWAPSASAAPKTDTVYFKNGDKLTGEVKGLRRGRLSLSTDAMGTILIEWDKISGIGSNQNIQVETTSGIRYFGHLANSEKGPEIIVVSDGEPKTLDAQRVVNMEPIIGRGIHALDVEVSVGYNFAKAGGVVSGNFDVNMDYRSLTRIESIRFSKSLSDSESQEASKRANLGFQHTRLLNDRWFTYGNLNFEQNDELDLDLRTSIGGGGGRYFIQTNRMLLSLDAGLQFSREDQEFEDEDTDSVEAIFTTKWDWFLFQNPELDWSTTIQIIPSLTESGRVRGEFDTALQWEIIGDLDWGISIYGSFDNKAESGSTSDYGVNTALTYEF